MTTEHTQHSRSRTSEGGEVSLEITSNPNGVGLGSPGPKTPEQVAAFMAMAQDKLGLTPGLVTELTKITPWVQSQLDKQQKEIIQIVGNLGELTQAVASVTTVQKAVGETIKDMKSDISTNRMDNSTNRSDIKKLAEIVAPLDPAAAAKLQDKRLEEGYWEGTKRALGRPITHTRALLYGAGGFGLYKLGGWLIPKVKGWFGDEEPVPTLNAMPMPPPLKKP